MLEVFHRVRFILGLIVGFVVGVWLSPQHKAVSIETSVDTVVYYKPIPTAMTTTEVRTISVPRLLFAPADTVHTTTVIVNGETAELQVPIERREYRDSTYYAVVSGAVVGDIHPTLEHIQFYSRNTTQTIEIHPPKIRPYVSIMLGKESFGAGAGITWGNNGFGADYIYLDKQHLWMGRYTRFISWKR